MTDCRAELPPDWFERAKGRRGPDDARQIRRWRNIRRHLAQLEKNCARRDLACRPRQRQSLLHWAYDSRLA